MVRTGRMLRDILPVLIIHEPAILDRFISMTGTIHYRMPHYRVEYLLA